jgi:hypothetical protein
MTSATTATSTRCSGRWTTWTGRSPPPTDGSAGAAGLGAEPHLGPAPLVPGVTVLARQHQARLVHLARRPARRRPAQQLAALRRRQRLALGRPHRPVLPARVPRRAARPELAQPRGAGGHVRHPALLAGPGHRRVPHRRPAAAGRGRPAARQPAQPRLPAGRGLPVHARAVGLERRPVWNVDQPETRELAALPAGRVAAATDPARQDRPVAGELPLAGDEGVVVALG